MIQLMRFCYSECPQKGLHVIHFHILVGRVQWSSEWDFWANETGETAHSEQPVNLSSVSISKTLGGLVTNLSNGFSIYNGPLQE